MISIFFNAVALITETESFPCGLSSNSLFNEQKKVIFQDRIVCIIFEKHKNIGNQAQLLMTMNSKFLIVGVSHASTQHKRK